MIAVDIETTIETRPRLAVVTVGFPDGTFTYEQTFGRAPSDAMRRLLESDDWITHNGTNFDLRVLKDYGIDFPTKHYDTLIGESVLLTSGRAQVRKTLAATQKRRVGKVTKGHSDHANWMKETLTDGQLNYIKEDVVPLFTIKAEQEREADRRTLRYALDQEQRLSIPVARMVSHGVPFRVDKLEALRDGAVADMEAAYARLKVRFGPKFNVRSPKQVLTALSRYHLASTDKAHLAEIASDPDVADIILVKPNLRLSGMYDSEWVDKYVYDAALHPSYWATGTDTIRFSSSDPNMQQIPVRMRPVVAGPDGSYMLMSDWAQMEIRTFASVTQDPTLIQDLKNEVDIMTLIMDACFAYHAPVAKALRQHCKAFLYGWAYGGGNNAEESNYAKIETEFGTQIKATGVRPFEFLAKRYPKARVYRTLTREQHKMKKPINLPWGHIRMMRAGSTPAAAIATQPQGIGAIGMKEAILLAEASELRDHVCATVHDELLAGPLDYDEALRLKPVLHECMLEGLKKTLGPDIEVLTETRIQEYWSK